MFDDDDDDGKLAVSDDCIDVLKLWLCTDIAFEIKSILPHSRVADTACGKREDAVS